MSAVQAGKAIVKNVLSGDTVVLMGQTPANGPPPEMQLSLASLRAPRLNLAGDEPFAWQSRQFLQSLCIGKPVRFKIEYTVAALNNRKFGNIFCGPNGSVDASKSMVERGFAVVKKTGSSERSANYDDLVAAEEAAKASGSGMHTADAAEIAAASEVIERKPSLERCQELFETLKSTVTEAIVDYVRDGSSLRVLLPAHKCIVSFNLAGVLCPMMQQRDTKRPAPCAAQARHFVEIRLLGRRVNIRVGGFSSKNGVFYGKIEHPKGDISAELLKNGFGKTSWTIDYTPNGPALKKAEADAQTARKGIFRNYQKPAARKGKGKARFTGIVSEIVSGDTVVVTVDGSNTTRRVSLSSISTPYQGRRNPKTKEEEAQPFSYHAKEFLRSNCIGRKVAVSVEYSRTGNAVEGRPAPLPREFGTVLLNGKADENLAAMLVGRGYARTVNHRDSDPRSAFYSKLVDKETVAKKSGKGQWGDKKDKKAESGEHRVVDLCADASKAKRYLNYFQRAGQSTNKAVVEYCFNAGKFKLFVPKENCMIFFGLSGVRTPSTARPARGGYQARPAEPYGDEALALVKSSIQQRDVQVEVESVDDRGTFMGSLFAKVDGKKRNLSLYLVEQGFGKLLRFSAERSPYADELFALEKAARETKLRIWENYVPRVRVDAAEEVVSVKRYSAKMAYILSAQEFYLASGGDSKAVDEGLAGLSASYGDKPDAPTGDDVVEPAPKLLVAAQFDGVWYRAKIDKVVRPDPEDADGAKTTLCEITFVDYGNKDVVEPSALRPLPDALKAIAPLASQCKLALVKVPGLEKQFGDAAAQYFAALTWDKTLSVQDASVEDGVKSVVITVNPDDGEAGPDAATVNELLCREGLARFKKPFTPRYGRGRPKASPFADVTKRIQAAHAAAAKAKSATGMFAYGDFDSDDDPKRDAF